MTQQVPDANDESLVAAMAKFVESEQEDGDNLYPSALLARYALARWQSFPGRTKVNNPSNEHRVNDLANGLAIRFDPDDSDPEVDFGILAENLATIINAWPLESKYGIWWRDEANSTILHEQLVQEGLLVVMFKQAMGDYRVEMFAPYQTEWPLEVWGPVLDANANFAPDEMNKALECYKKLGEEYAD